MAASLPPSFYQYFRCPSDDAGARGDVGRGKWGKGRSLLFESGLGYRFQRAEGEVRC